MEHSPVMPRLNSRQKFIPGGFRFYDPHLRWTAPANASFQTIVDGLRVARMANPGVTKVNNLSTDPAIIAEEVDSFNATICEQHGWTDYYTSGAGGAAIPFLQVPPRPFVQRARNLAVGTVVNVEWLASGAEAVPVEQANQRAETCAKCPLNDKEGDWLAKFAKSAQDGIRSQLNRKFEMKLETPFDEQLGSCRACDCPMALKVWIPLDKFLSKMLPAAKDALHESCWIKSEGKF